VPLARSADLYKTALVQSSQAARDLILASLRSACLKERAQALNRHTFWRPFKQTKKLILQNGGHALDSSEHKKRLESQNYTSLTLLAVGGRWGVVFVAFKTESEMGIGYVRLFPEPVPVVRT
jgi:hypothetical protein